jgi:hypothetical protein
MNTFTCQSNNNSGNSGRSGNFASASKSGKVCRGPFCSRGRNSGNVEEEEDELEFDYE